MQPKKIAIFSKGAKTPLHPRIELEIQLLEDEGHSVELFSPSTATSTVKHRLLKLLSLSLFEWEIIHQFQPHVANFDTVIIYDSQLLPLSAARKKHQTVIFETLDDNIELIVYHVFKKLPLLAFLKNVCRFYLKQKERFYLNRFVDKTIVNSERLTEVFKEQKAVLNYYSSPFEGLTLNQNAEKTAFLYLGKISLDKGIKTMLLLSKQFEIPIYLFGDFDKAEQKELHQLISNCKLAIHQPKMAIPALKDKLKELSQNYRLIGLSLIESVHISYQFQDANKDIDYIALGIPFVGNERPTTKKIIDAGCGVLIQNDKNIKCLINEKEKYNFASTNCAAHYQRNFSQKAFSKIFLTEVN